MSAAILSAWRLWRAARLISKATEILDSGHPRRARLLLNRADALLKAERIALD